MAAMGRVEEAAVVEEAVVVGWFENELRQSEPKQEQE